MFLCCTVFFFCQFTIRLILIVKCTHNKISTNCWWKTEDRLLDTFYSIVNDLILDDTIGCLLSTETWLGTDASIILTKASPQNFNFFILYQGRKEMQWNGLIFL